VHFIAQRHQLAVVDSTLASGSEESNSPSAA
jgi:hypothetical protein